MNRTKIFIVITFLFTFAVGVSVAFLLSFDSHVVAQSVQFPNELKDYKFFGKGKLEKIKLGVSTRNDVKVIFGQECEKECDYDENFKIKIEYLAALDDCMTTKDVSDKLMCPQNNFVGTISSITFEPKKEQSLNDLPISEFSKFSGGTSITKGSGISTSYTSFTDKYGLEYSIDNRLSGKAVLRSRYPSFIEGNLYSIKYIFTDDIIRKVFTVEYTTRKKELNN